MRHAVALLLAGCGRLAFEPTNLPADGSSTVMMDAVALDGFPACTSPGSYLASGQQVSYRVADLTCVDIGATLVTIDDAGEDLNLVGVANSL